jgi:hypothetical protein
MTNQKSEELQEFKEFENVRSQTRARITPKLHLLHGLISTRSLTYVDC